MTGRMTPRRSYSPSPAAFGGIPIRKNSFVVTESQYAHVLPTVSPRSSSPAVRSGQWSGRVTPSALETCMETSFIATNSSVFPNHADHSFASSAPGPSRHHQMPLDWFSCHLLFAQRTSTKLTHFSLISLVFDVLLIGLLLCFVCLQAVLMFLLHQPTVPPVCLCQVSALLLHRITSSFSILAPRLPEGQFYSKILVRHDRVAMALNAARKTKSKKVNVRREVVP
jgi:hypothetical protein